MQGQGAMRNPKPRFFPRCFGAKGTRGRYVLQGGGILFLAVALLFAAHGFLAAQKGNGTEGNNATLAAEVPRAAELPPMQRFPVTRTFRSADAFGREEPTPSAPIPGQSTQALPFTPLPERCANVPLVPGPPEHLYDAGLRVLRQKKPEEARQRLHAFAQSYPDHPLADNARYWIGETWYTQGAYTQAIAVWLDAAAHTPSSPKTPAALLKIGYARFALGQPQKGRHCLQCLLRTSPPERIATLARKKLREES
ncbi:MAG: tol-pal system protein YbgF [Thermodesulfobacteriota bacterium]